jgi:hypothetical protein
MDMFGDSYVTCCDKCGDSVHSDGHTKKETVGQPITFICNRRSPPNHVRLILSKAEISEAYRVSGDVLCNICGRKYDQHPLIENILNHNDEPYLNFTCAGDIIKL